MAVDPARLIYQLQNTGLQNKDNPLYQLLSDMIGIVTGINRITAAIAGGGGTTIIVTNNNIGFPPLSLEDNHEDGLLSFPGVNGVNGINGLTIPGMDGADGEDSIPILGPIGLTGATGATGANGADGNTIPGIDGIDGDDAIPIPGPIGATGPTGITGSTGIGIPGFDGYDGDDALIIPGPIGPAGPMVPYYLAASDTFLVPIYKQALFAQNIDNEGIITVDGFLIEVDDNYTPPIISLHTVLNYLTSPSGINPIAFEQIELLFGFTISTDAGLTTITVLEPGFYAITGMLCIGQIGTLTPGTLVVDMLISAGGSRLKFGANRVTAIMPDTYSLNVHVIVELSAGDTISCEWQQDSAIANSGLITVVPVTSIQIPAASIMIQKIGD